MSQRIAAIKAKVDIAAFIENIGGTVERRTEFDAWVPVVCPFHADHQASASLNRMVGRFVCHGCGTRGDVVDLSLIHLGIEGEEFGVKRALDWLAQEFDVTAEDAPVPVRRWR